MVRDVALRTVVGGHLLGLRVDRHGDVSDAPVGERRAAGELDDVLGVGRAHDAAVIDAHVHEQLVELDILLGVGVQQIMVLKARDGDDGLAVELSVVKTVEEVDAAGTRGGDAGAEPSRPLGVGASHEGGGLLVAHLDEADLLLLLPQRLDDAVDAVAGDAENRVDAPVDQGVNQNVRRRGRHKGSPPRVSRKALANSGLARSLFARIQRGKARIDARAPVLRHNAARSTRNSELGTSRSGAGPNSAWLRQILTCLPKRMSTGECSAWRLFPACAPTFQYRAPGKRGGSCSENQ